MPAMPTQESPGLDVAGPDAGDSFDIAALVRRAAAGAAPRPPPGRGPRGAGRARGQGACLRRRYPPMMA